MKDSVRWLIHIATGAALIFFLGSHMGIMHLKELFAPLGATPAGAEPIDWPAVAFRAKETSILVIYIAFLLLALFHGLYGLWNILIEALSPRRIERPLGWLLALLGACAAAYGSYTTYLAFVMNR